MVGEMIKEYLVGLGVKVDKPGFAEFDSTVNKTSSTIASATSGWTKNFVTASGIIATALASVTTSVVGLMNAAAKQDLAMEKYARSMMVSKGAALEMKLAVDALGESVQDIQLTPELFGRYKALVADGRNMKVGGDYEATMKNFRDLVFEFTRLKQEASYALQWVGYYLNKYLAKPLSDAKASFREFNDKLIKDMPVWTEKIARALVYIINIGRHFWDLLKAIGKTVYDIWEAFPRGVKIATASLAAFFMLLKASPLSRMLALVGSLLLLVDDYFGYMEGKQAAFGDTWSKLNEYIDSGKQKMQDWGKILAPIWDNFIADLISAKNAAVDFGQKCSDWFERIGQSKELNDFVDTAKRLGSALWDLGDGIIDLISDSFSSFFDSLEKQGTAVSFTDLMERLFYIFLDLIDTISHGIEVFAGWLSELGKSEVVRDFLDAVAEFLGVIVELILAILELVNVAFRAFFGELDKTDTVFSFKDALIAVLKIITMMIRGISSLIRGLVNLFKLMKDSRVFRAFWEGLGKVVKGFTDIVLNAVSTVGKLGQALLALVTGDFKRASKLAGEALFGKASAGGRKTNATTDEKEMWGLAQQVSGKTGIKPEFIYAQWWHETAGFKSSLARDNYNFGGMTQAEPNGEENKQPDGNMYYMQFSSPQEWADYYADYIMHDDYAYARNAQNVYEFAQGLKDGGYYGASVENYAIGLENGMENIPGETEQNNDRGDNVPENNDYNLQNPSGGMRDPTTWDYVKGKVSGILKSTSYIKNALSGADPALIRSFMSQQIPAYSSERNGSVTIINNVDVGGVAVNNPNASADDIGNAVGNKAASALESRSQYVLQNRSITGGPSWV